MLEQIKAQWRFLVVGIALIAFAAAALAAGVAVLAQGQDDPASRQPVAAQGAAANVEAPVAVPAAADSTGDAAASGAQPTPRPPQGATYHTVASGETLGKIAAAYGLTTGALATANGLSNPNLIRVGQRLIIPAR